MKQYLILASYDFPANGNLPASTSGTLVDADGGPRLDRVHIRKFDAEGKPQPATGMKAGIVVKGVFVVTPPFQRSTKGADGTTRFAATLVPTGGTDRFTGATGSGVFTAVRTEGLGRPVAVTFDVTVSPR